MGWFRLVPMNGGRKHVTNEYVGTLLMYWLRGESENLRVKVCAHWLQQGACRVPLLIHVCGLIHIKVDNTSPTFFHSAKMKPKYPINKHCHTVPVMLLYQVPTCTPTRSILSRAELSIIVFPPFYIIKYLIKGAKCKNFQLKTLKT